jgi:ribosomal protein L11 methyltransferase
LAFSLWEEEDRDYARVECYCESRAAAAKSAAQARRVIRGLDLQSVATVVSSRLPPRDWQEAWKAFFHVERVSRRVVVKPTWESYEARRGDCVVEVEPGMSFGTGQHATTRSCLRLLDWLLAEGTPRLTLDMGCGSGILAIAAAKLGAPSVLAVDNDPVAVRIARVNVKANGVNSQVKCCAGDLRVFGRKRYDLVVANILADVLIQYAPTVVRCVARGRREGRLILSGILVSQYREVRRAYEALGLRQLRSVTDGEWRSGCFAWKG